MRAITNSQRMCDKRRDDVLDHAVGEIVLLGVAAHVHERQDGDRRLVGEGERAGGRRCGVRRLAAFDDASMTSPTKRKPLRATVRMKFWSWPLSPIAVRAALMWLVIVDSLTMRPRQTASSRSSLLTTRCAVLDQKQQQIEDLRADRTPRRKPV